MQYVGRYVLDLYCDGGHAVATQFSGRSFTAAKQNAELAGWRLHMTKTATCPECVMRLWEEARHFTYIRRRRPRRTVV